MPRCLLDCMVYTEFVHNRQTFKISKECRSNTDTFCILSPYFSKQTSSTRKLKRYSQSQLWPSPSKGTHIPGSCVPVDSVTSQGKPVMVREQTKPQRYEKREKEKKRNNDMMNDNKSDVRQSGRFETYGIEWMLNFGLITDILCARVFNLSLPR